MKNNIKVGFVLIGRNEGGRLIDSLDSLKSYFPNVVYVDSASTDDSIKNAHYRGASVVNLDLATPFTAARARNAGYSKLMDSFPNVEYVHFIDGDCVLVDGWMEKAIDFLSKNKDVAVVCGRRRERYPDKTIYNQMCDNEWATKIGLTKSCGGDALFVASIFKAVNGFNESLIAGEEPELCIRIRALGHKIWRLDEEMTLHDAAIYHFTQWWKRCIRSGFAYAEGASLHGGTPEFHCVQELRRTLLWGGVIPFFIIGLLFLNYKYALVLASVYILQTFRLALKLRKTNVRFIQLSILMVMVKFPETYGALKYYKNKLLGKKTKLIEYK